MTDVLVIGDCHGHVDRLQALLVKADVANKDCTVVQLGDLGHFGYDTAARDIEAWLMAQKGSVDVVLWGNHDRAVVDDSHTFGGFTRPGPEIKHIMRSMEKEGRLLAAYEAHGWLITHAGLHAEFEHQKVDLEKIDPKAIADWLNERVLTGDREAVLDAVGRSRGGWAPHGGILWRDASEPLYEGVRQVFGHSAHPQHIVLGQKDEWYCIDIGGKGGPGDPEAECLAGIWLPSQEIIRVDHNQGDF